MNHHTPTPSTPIHTGGTPAPVSRIGNAAYALEKCSVALQWAMTPNARACARREYEAACADMRALLNQFITEDAS